MTARPTPTEVTTLLWQERFPGALALFCAGSVIRGDHTAHSDLDIVVLFDSVPHAWREAIVFHTWPVELFVHDLETLAYFVEQDCRERRPCLPSMLADAIVIPEPFALSDRLQVWARSFVQNPPAVPPATLDDERYFISDLLDDLRDPRPRAELVAIAARLHDQLGSFILSANGRWSGAGKHLPRRLFDLGSPLSDDFQRAFDAVFIDSNPEPLIALTEHVLLPFGGPLFAGYRSDAPSTARSKLPSLDL